MTDRKLTPDEVDRLLDGLLAHGSGGDEHGLLDAARLIRSLADEPVPTDVRNRHLTSIRRAAAEKAGETTPAATGTSWWAGMRRRAAAVAAATSLAFTATGGGAVALAQDAGPDDLLYGIKRASESVALAVSSDDADLHLRFAERRLDELDAAPEHADELAPQAAEHLAQAHAQGASAEEAGAEAVLRLSEVLAQLEGGDASPNAVIAVSRACARIADKHGHDSSSCGYEGELPGRSGDAPGRSEEAPGRSGDAPGRSGNAPGNAPTGEDATAEDARPEDAGPPEGVPAPDGDDDE